MELISADERAATVRVTPAELRIIGQALNEIANGVHLYEEEFQTRMGSTRDEVREVLRQTGQVFDSVKAVSGQREPPPGARGSA